MACEGNKFVTSVYWSAALSGTNPHSEIHSLSTCKSGDLLWSIPEYSDAFQFVQSKASFIMNYHY